MELNPEQEIKLRAAMVELRNKMSRELDEMDKLLKPLYPGSFEERSPTQEDGIRALWLVHYVDTSSEYEELERMVRDLRDSEEGLYSLWL